MKIAIPTVGKSISEHFGRCEKYSFFVVENNKVVSQYEVDSPQHAPNVIPEFLSGEDTDLVITSGIGKKATALFEQYKIKVITGCSGDIGAIIENYLANTLVTGDSTCKHEEEE